MFHEARGASRRITPRCSKAAKGKQKLTLLGYTTRRWNGRIEDEKDQLQGTVATPIVKPVSEMSNTFTMNDSFKGKEEKRGGAELKMLAPV